MATTWNPSDKGGSVTLSNGNLTAAVTSSAAHCVRATQSTSTAPTKSYWEVSWDASSSAVDLNQNIAVGVANGTQSLTASLGASTNSVAWQGNWDQVLENGSFIGGSAFRIQVNDVIGFALDLGASTLKIYVNNTLKWTVSSLPTGDLYPAYGGDSNPYTSQVTGRFATASFTYTPPSGYSAFDTTPVLTMAATLAPQQVALGASGIGATLGATAFAMASTVFGLNVVAGAPTVDIEVISGGIASLDVHAAAMDEAGFVVIAGSSGTITASLGAPEFEGSFGLSMAAALAAPTFSGTVQPGQILYANDPLGAPAFAAALRSDALLSTADTLGAPVFAATLAAGSVDSFALTIPPQRFAATGFAGAVMSIDETLPPQVFALEGHGPYTMTMVVGLAAPSFGATVLSAVASHFRTWVMNTRNRAVTEYTNFPFNSFARIGDRLFAAGPDGICEIAEQGDDAGTAIDAIARTGALNFGTLLAKRVPRAYTSLETTGDMEFHTITGADGVRAYLLPWNNTTAVQQRRIPIGRGPKSVYWQYELKNRAGADFTLHALLLYPEKSARLVAPS